MTAKMRDGIIQRGSTWSYKIQVTDPATGVRKPKWVGGFRTRAEAKAERDKSRHAVNAGSYVEQRKVRLGEYLVEWLEGQRSQLKATTHASYASQVARYVTPKLGGHLLTQVTVPVLNRFYGDLVTSGGRDGKPVSLRTVRYTHAVLRKALQDAVKAGLLAANPAALADLPKHEQQTDVMRLAESHTIAAWSAEQLRTFAAAVDDEPLGGLFLLGANTGLRRGELLGLRWSDVDFDAARLRVGHTLVTVAHRLQVSTPKSGKTRSFKLDPESLAILRRQRARQGEQRLALGAAWSNDLDLVWTREDGAPIHPHHATKKFHRIVRRAGVPVIRCHDLRHTYATLALQAGVPIKVVSERLGHATVQLTWDTYAHVLPDQDDQAAELFYAHVYGAAQ